MGSGLTAAAHVTGCGACSAATLPAIALPSTLSSFASPLPAFSSQLAQPNLPFPLPAASGAAGTSSLGTYTNAGLAAYTNAGLGAETNPNLAAAPPPQISPGTIAPPTTTITLPSGLPALAVGDLAPGPPARPGPTVGRSAPSSPAKPGPTVGLPPGSISLPVKITVGVPAGPIGPSPAPAPGQPAAALTPVSGATGGGASAAAFPASPGAVALTSPFQIGPLERPSAGVASTGRRFAPPGGAPRAAARPEPRQTTWAGTVLIPVKFVPTWIWFVLGASVLLAAIAAGAAFASARSARRQAGQFAAMSAAALTDPLTGLLNRRGFIEAIERELARADRYEHPFVLAYVDVRGLKAVNDSEGHLAGDAVLSEVANLLRDSARAVDVAGRLGGDEMCLLLVEQGPKGAEAVVARIAGQVPQRRAALKVRTPWDLTIGTAAYPEDGETVKDLLAAADRRLYKQRGIALR